MIAALSRKTSNVMRDQVLRRWLFRRLLNGYDAPPPFTPHRPPYLDSILPLSPETPLPPTTFATLDVVPLHVPLVLDLAGERVRLEPVAPEALFTRDYADTETLLAVHRFAWLPLAGDAAPAGWVDALWRAWAARCGTPDTSWAWHPYTAAERAINILRFARRHGLPGDMDETLDLLARHAPAIAAKLEYFGDHDTGNHLSNNGRGLYLLGLALGLEKAAALGARILLAEAGRIFTPSGLLREGSSHYHLLLTRNYAECWLAARAHGRPEAAELEAVTRHALEAAPALELPGGMPLVGDISPDCPPGFLNCLLPSGEKTNGWCALLDDTDAAALAELRAGLQPVFPGAAGQDGWHRLVSSPWSLLAHAAPAGWLPMPGHAHQDIGSFELHYGRVPVIVDPGRGAYGATGEAAEYVTAAAHNGFTIDGNDPYPPNKPYYSKFFRTDVGGTAPRAAVEGHMLSIAHDGFSRLRGVGTATRTITTRNGRVTITDAIDGAGRHEITRRLHTSFTLTPDADGRGARLDGPNGLHLHLRADAPISAAPAKRWVAYGRSEPATVLSIAANTTLPATLTIEMAPA